MRRKDYSPTGSLTEQSPSSAATKTATLLAGSALPATAVVSAYSGASADPVAVLAELHKNSAALHSGDLAQIEGMLIHQATALQAMFMDLACRAKDQENLAAVHCLTGLALRAQAGSRATLQTLSELKSPRQVAFVQQTNVAHNQQINSAGVQQGGVTHASAKRTISGG